MEIGKIQTGTFSVSDIEINSQETSRRLCVPADFENAVTGKCTELVRNSAQPKYCFGITSVDLSEKNTVNLGFAKIQSANLYKNLQGCEYAFVMAVTLGIEADRLTSRLGVSSGAQSFIADGIASALAEAVADKLSDMLSERYELKPRFSPGYGDLPLSAQREVLDFLSAQKLIGITLGENLLMVPKKSITAIQGIIKNKEA